MIAVKYRYTKFPYKEGYLWKESFINGKWYKITIVKEGLNETTK